MIIKVYPCEGNKNNDKLIEDIKTYQKNSPCCNNFPKCTHPHFQTDSLIHCSFPELELSYFDNLKKYLKDIQHSDDRADYKILTFKMWAFISRTNEKSKQLQHRHALFKDNTLEISSLRYLTDTDIGTVFDFKYVQIHLKPKLNTWFFWPSELWHSPEAAKVNKKERITLATSIVLSPKSLKM
jgi:hypothetical protein